jgi:RNA-directed DNA polymerase
MQQYPTHDLRKRPILRFSLGYTFRPRLSRGKAGKFFVNFLPAVSGDAMKAMSRELRSWRINKRSNKTLDDLAHMFNKVVQGWINY